MNKFQQMLADNPVLLADGAMGTMLFEAGLTAGDPPEPWNVQYPERVRAIQRAYLQAGTRLILTNTFGGNRFRLSMHNLQDRVAEFNRAGAENLRAEVAALGVQALVAGDIGPSGELLEPLGTLTFDEAVAGFAEQAAALAAGGVDMIWIETMSHLDEVRAALLGVRQVAPELPVVVTLTFDTHGCTMMGTTPEQAAQALSDLKVDAMGGNCGNGPDELLTVIRKMHAQAANAVLVAKSNAGMPKLVRGKAVYDAAPEVMGEYARTARDAGARIIGGCCGNTPAHIQAMAQALGL